jgi:hypothetical protein
MVPHPAHVVCFLARRRRRRWRLSAPFRTARRHPPTFRLTFWGVCGGRDRGPARGCQRRPTTRATFAKEKLQNGDYLLSTNPAGSSLCVRILPTLNKVAKHAASAALASAAPSSSSSSSFSSSSS